MSEEIEIDLDIPKNIFQTHKSFSYVKSNSVLNACLNSWLKNNYKRKEKKVQNKIKRDG